MDYALAAEARLKSEPGGHVEAVRFLVSHLREILHAFVDDYVAGGAGAVAATGMFQMDSVIEADVEDRFGQAVLFIGHVTRLELDRLPVDGDLRHTLL